MKERTPKLLVAIAMAILAVTTVILLVQRIVPLFELQESVETVPTTEATTAPTTEPTDPPPPEKFLLTFVGNVALQAPEGSGFYTESGEDFTFPLRNAQELFGNDSCTFVNLESILSDGEFTNDSPVRVPVAYGQILSEGDVDFACLSNEDAVLLGQQGLDDTVAALDALGIGHVGSRKTAIFTTEDGLKIGIYAETAPQKADDYEDIFLSLRASGAEMIVVMFHWGQKYDFLPSTQQEKLARAAVDAGADIVYGHHPQVLQLMQHYKEGLILYSTGTFLSSEAAPLERDTAVLQVQVVRYADGTIRVGSIADEPWLVTGDGEAESFQPRPVDTKKEKEIADRISQKLAGTYSETRLVTEQTPTQTTDGTAPESSASTEGTAAPTESVPATEASAQPTEG